MFTTKTESKQKFMMVRFGANKILNNRRYYLGQNNFLSFDLKGNDKMFSFCPPKSDRQNVVICKNSKEKFPRFNEHFKPFVKTIQLPQSCAQIVYADSISIFYPNNLKNLNEWLQTSRKCYGDQFPILINVRNKLD